MASETGAAVEGPVLTADQILAAVPKIGDDWVDCPEWGTKVHVHGLGKREQRKINDDAVDPETGKTDEDVVEMSMFMNGVLDPKFTEEQVERLWETDPRPINRVLMRILRLSGASEKADTTAVRTFPE